MSSGDHDFFAEHGFLNLGPVLKRQDLERFQKMFDHDLTTKPYFWHKYGHWQHANYEALISSPEFDDLIRHPSIYPRIEALMGGPLCFGEIGLRLMKQYQGEVHQAWHRDRAHRPDHSLRLDYVQLMVYLTDVGEGDHCISLSPESVRAPVTESKEAQLAKGGQYHLHGPAGTCAVFNASLLHTATTRPTENERRTVQIYYGHRDRPPLANDSTIPPAFWRDSEDEETRGFYGVLNDRSRMYLKAFTADGDISSGDRID